MTTAKTTASRSKRGAVGRPGANGKLKTITIEGVTLDLPAKVPFRVLSFYGDERGAADVVDYLKAILGDEQMEKLWQIEVDVSKGVEPLGALLNRVVMEVNDAYGITPGE